MFAAAEPATDPADATDPPAGPATDPAAGPPGDRADSAGRDVPLDRTGLVARAGEGFAA